MSELSRFNATSQEVDAHLREVLAEDVYLRFQRWVGERAVAEAVDWSTTQADALFEDDYKRADGAAQALNWVDPRCGGGPWPSKLVTD